MAEYISRDAALDCFACDLGKKDYSVSYQGFMTEAAFRINSIPAADVRPVVLCRECRYAYDSVGGWCCSHGICVDCTVREDFFCADGARMDGDGDV